MKNQVNMTKNNGLDAIRKHHMGNITHDDVACFLASVKSWYENHDVLSKLAKKQVIKTEVIGQNFYICFKPIMLTKNDITFFVGDVIANIVNSRWHGRCFRWYDQKSNNKKLVNVASVYKFYTIIGQDILTNGLGTGDYTKSHSHYQKIKKYNKG